MTSFLGGVPIALLLIVSIIAVEGQLGVVYSPFVKLDDGPSTRSYTAKDVKLMLGLIENDNFPLLTTYGVGAPNEQFRPNLTRYKCSSVVHTAVAAAEINKEKKSLALSVYQGIYKSSPAQRLNAEIEVGFEMAQNANTIFNGTVPGIIFPSSSGLNELFDMEIIIKTVSDRAREMHLKVGVRIWNCGSTIPNLDKNDKKIEDLFSHFDFIICSMMPQENSYAQGPQHFYEEVVKEMYEVEQAINVIMNGKIKVMLETGWASKYSNETGNQEEVMKMKSFWENMGKWANEKKQLVFMSEAFDNPWKMSVKDVHLAAHYGLWTNVEGYFKDVKELFVRKVAEIQTHNYQKPQPVTPATGHGKITYKPTTKPQTSPAKGSGAEASVQIKYSVIFGFAFLTFMIIY